MVAAVVEGGVWGGAVFDDRPSVHSEEATGGGVVGEAGAGFSDKEQDPDPCAPPKYRQRE